MKRKISIALIVIMCLSLLLQGSPVVAANDKNDNSPTYNSKYTVKKVKSPPYCISVDAEVSQIVVFGSPVRKKTRLNIIGQRNYDGIAGEWVFYVTFYLAGVGNMEAPRGLEGAFILEAAAELQGTATGKMLDLAEERKKKEEEEKRKIKPVFTPKRTTPRPTPTRTDSEYIRNYEPNPRDLYKCEFEADLKGSLMNVGPTTVYGGIGIEDQWTHVEENFIDPGMTVEDTGKVTMYIDSKDNVSVSLELQEEEYGPFRGVFTCEEDLDIQRKDSGTWPIWGVWTDRNPYEPMPDFEKDFETV